MFERIEKRFPGCRGWVAPLVICASSIANFALYYLGLAYMENKAREIGFIVISICIAIFSGLAFLKILKEKCLPLWKLGVLFGIVLLFFAYFAIWYLNFETRGNLINKAEQFIVFCVPALLAGICCAGWKKEKEFFKNLEKIGFFFIPAALIYVNGMLFFCSPFEDGWYLGIINYMSFSYGLMPVLFAIMIRFSEKAEVTVSLAKKSPKRPQLVRGLMIALFWAATIAAGTRGTYFCVVLFCLCWVFSSFIHKETEKRRTVLLSAAMISVLLFNLFVYAPPGMKIWRMNGFIDGIRNGEIITAEQDERVTDAVIDALVAEDGGVQLVNRGDDLQDVRFPEGSIGAENYSIRNRGTLYKLAFKEFLKSPIIGMKPGGYVIKYGLYPHSAALEILCETGIVGAIFFFCVIIWAAIHLLRISEKRRECRLILLFLLVCAVKTNISGTVWSCPEMMFALGYGMICPGRNENLTKK